MARKAHGQIVEYRGKRGTSYAARFHAYGKRRFVTLGHSGEGWTRARAAGELANILAAVRRGIWQPPRLAPVVEEPEPEPTFHEFASEWWADKKRELRPNTVAAYEYELSYHLLPFFARYRLSEITVREVDRYKAAKVREREA